MADSILSNRLFSATGEDANREAFRLQAAYCETNGAPVTARICAALAEALSPDSATGRRVLAWAQPPIADALPLRLVGGVHALYLRGEVPELDRLFDGSLDSLPAIVELMRRVLETHDHALLPWLDSPPQTNEAARSTSLMAALAWFADRGSKAFEIWEIGSSAGLNLMIDRYQYQLGDHVYGPQGSPVVIAPEWRGASPPASQPNIVSTRGVDLRPVDVAQDAAAERLRAYVWHDHRERFDRLDRAIEMLRAEPVRLEHGSAADWLAERLAEPAQPDVTRVLMHSIVWQYISDDDQARIEAMMADAGGKAHDDAGLAWLSLEANRDTLRHELHVRYWPGGGNAVHIANAHPHGAWVEWLAD